MIHFINIRQAARLILSCCLFLEAFVITAQDYCVSGIVQDEQTGELIPFVSVRVQTTSTVIQTQTGVGGAFIICRESKIDSIYFDMFGYESAKVGVSSSGKYTLKPLSRELSAVHVEGFRNKLNYSATPGSFGIITRRNIESTDQTSLLPVLNQLPGVIMDSRGYGGSHRLSIRGSFLRAPFAVRNVKMYLNGIPLSSPDGTTPLELPDSEDLAGIEVIKGPAGSIWGSGNGGVLLLGARRARPESIFVSSGFTAGEYDWFRSNSSVELDKKKWNLRLSYNWQENYGYRDQEFNRKQQLSGYVGYKATKRLTYFLYTTIYNGDWGLPGALTAQQVKEDARQAVAYSVENGAMLWRQRFFTGITQNLYLNGGWVNNTSIYYSTNDKKNPYGTSPLSQGYKAEDADGLGGRTEFLFSAYRANLWNLNFSTGAEFQSEHFTISEYDNVLGQPGDFKYFYDVKYLQSMGFASVDFHWKEKILLTAGASTNFLQHKIDGYAATGFSFDSLATQTPDILPRVAISIRLDSLIYVHASLSKGNSNPTVFEQIVALDGVYNVLDPETGINHEVGVKGRLKGFDFDLVAYRFLLRNAILPDIDTNVSISVTTDLRYFNGGNTVQDGLEFSLSRSVFRNDHHALDLRLGVSSTRYHFRDYLSEDVQLEGYFLPGVPLNTVNSGLTYSCMKNKLRLELMDYWTDRIPLNNDNSTWSSAYHLVNSKVNFLIKGKKHVSFNLHFGVNNVFNESYTSFFQLNGNGGKYYNPAPPRNVYAGVRINWM